MKQSGEKYNEMKRKDAERKRIAHRTRKEISAAEVKREKELNVARGDSEQRKGKGLLNSHAALMQKWMKEMV